MKKFRTVLRKINIVTEVYCNKCEKCITESERVELFHGFGYGSKHDQEMHSLDICEKCFLKFIKTCKIPCKITYLNTFGEDI